MINYYSLICVKLGIKYFNRYQLKTAYNLPSMSDARLFKARPDMQQIDVDLLHVWTDFYAPVVKLIFVGMCLV